jgi:hypothetical protein
MSVISNIKYIKLYFKISPLIDQLQREFTMKLSTNMVIQVVATLAQLVNQLGGVVPVKYQTVILAVLSGVQGVTAAISHFSNPDGTPAKVAYVPPAEPKV